MRGLCIFLLLFWSVKGQTGEINLTQKFIRLPEKFIESLQKEGVEIFIVNKGYEVDNEGPFSKLTRVNNWPESLCLECHTEDLEGLYSRTNRAIYLREGASLWVLWHEALHYYRDREMGAKRDQLYNRFLHHVHEMRRWRAKSNDLLTPKKKILWSWAKSLQEVTMLTPEFQQLTSFEEIEIEDFLSCLYRQEKMPYGYGTKKDLQKSIAYQHENMAVIFNFIDDLFFQVIDIGEVASKLQDVELLTEMSELEKALMAYKKEVTKLLKSRSDKRSCHFFLR